MQLRLFGIGSGGDLRALEPSPVGQILVSSQRVPPAALDSQRRGRTWHVWLMGCLVSSGEPRGDVNGAPGHNGMRLSRG